MAIEGTAVRAGSWAFAQAHLEHLLHVQRGPTIASSLLRKVRDTERNTEGIGGTLSAGVTGENSPRAPYLPVVWKNRGGRKEFECDNRIKNRPSIDATNSATAEGFQHSLGRSFWLTFCSLV